MESFSESKNLARVAAGFKGGGRFTKPAPPQNLTIVDGWPDNSKAIMKSAGFVVGSPTDVWSERRSK